MLVDRSSDLQLNLSDFELLLEVGEELDGRTC